MTQPQLPPPWFGEHILKWYDLYGRKSLPWKNPKSAYSIWLSEIMLQQTQVATVIPYFKKFIATFPTIESLAQAPLDHVIALWAGLGYYARARNLHKTAHILVEHYNATLPADIDALKALPGIGKSTAAAILAQSYDIRAPILDANVKRVLCRFYSLVGWPGLKSVEENLWKVSELTTPLVRANDYTQGIMDLGALVCKSKRPLCEQCPVSLHCMSFNQKTIEHYPESKPTKNKPSKHTEFLMVFNQENKILLHKRPAKGIWGGLWCLPELFNLEALDLQFRIISKKNRRRHTFTHYHLNYDTILARCTVAPLQIMQNQYEWYTLSSTKQLGLPAPHKILITELITQLERETHVPYSVLS